MFQNIDTLHSYDPLAIIRALLNLLFGIPTGSKATTTIVQQIHETTSPFWSTFKYDLINFFAKYAVFAFLFSIAMVLVIIIYALRYHAMRQQLIETVTPKDGSVENDTGDAVENPKWKLVLEHINSDDPNKWKLAIIEADIMLNELLDTLNLPGDSVGEKLKSVEMADFKSIDEAWEAHKIRNAIAHGGSEFLLNEREAKRVIGLYEQVFDEFELIY